MSILHLKPLRKPRANQISTSVFFYSPKLDRQVWCESNLEWDTAIVLDQEPSIIDFCEQAIELEWSKSKWIPDFVAITESNGEYRLLIIEVKYMKDLLKEKDHFSQKFSETKKWIEAHQKELTAAATSLPVSGVDFLVVTDLILQQSFRVRNCRKLIQAVIGNQYEPTVAVQVRGLLQGIAHITLESLINSLLTLTRSKNTNQDIVYSTVYAMMYKNEIGIDLEALLSPQTFVFGTPQNRIGIEMWLKMFDWENQRHYLPDLIQHEDIYFIAKTPEKSIGLWSLASERLGVVEKLLDLPVEDIKMREITYLGKQIHWSTAYRWVRAYRNAQGDIRALIPHHAKCGRKANHSDPAVVELWDYGTKQYLQRERKSIKLAFKAMEAYAYQQNLAPHCPSYSTFYRRIKTLDRREVAKRREGGRNAERAFELSESEFPHADFPLQSVQIDHTPIDVLVVDDEQRLVTERPYLTVAIDCYTRCILGYYLTLNEPSRLSIAMAMISCVEDKGETLEKIRDQFPSLDATVMEAVKGSRWREVYGLPFTLHMDNGADFQSDDVRLFGARYKIHLHYRAVKKPQHGAYVERFLGTLNNRLHALPGTTFSNAQEKKDYPAEKQASFTIKELEARVLAEILLYHEDYHSQLCSAPIKMWVDSFARGGGEAAVSRNLSQVDPEYFHLDVLPSEMRSVQKSGVKVSGLGYADPRIQKWVGEREPGQRKAPRRFLIRYDPRDLRAIFFYDPEERGYIPLKCNDRFVQVYFQSNPLSLWQWEAVKRAARKNYRQSPLDFEKKKRALVEIQQSMDTEAAARTKSARIKRARLRHNQEEQARFSEIAGLPQTYLEDFSNIDESLFQLPDEEEVKVIYMPPETLNPFYGIEEQTQVPQKRRESLDE